MLLCISTAGSRPAQGEFKLPLVLVGKEELKPNIVSKKKPHWCNGLARIPSKFEIQVRFLDGV